MFKKLLLVVVAMLSIFSCISTKFESVPKVELIHELTIGLSAPESVIYDADRELVYVSNVRYNQKLWIS